MINKNIFIHHLTSFNQQVTRLYSRIDDNPQVMRTWIKHVKAEIDDVIHKQSQPLYVVNKNVKFVSMLCECTTLVSL